MNTNDSQPIAKSYRLGSEIYEFLFRQIMSLEIRPGDRIGIDKLARQLGVSQTPIREALNQLEGQGLAVKTHLSGYRAAPQLTRKQFDDLGEMRLLMEPAASAKAALRINDAQLQRLNELMERMADPVESDRLTAYSDFARLDAEFHDLIGQASGNEMLHRTIRHQRAHLHLFRLSYNAAVTAAAVAEHHGIVQGFRDRDPAAAAEAMRQHIILAHARFNDAPG